MKKFEYLKFSENYDDFTRYCKNSVLLSDNEKEKKLFQWRHCNHLFVKVKEENTIECVKCGLTNRFINIEKKLRDERNLLFNNLTFKDTTYETDEFNYQYPDYRSMNNLNENEVLSNDLIVTNHPNILFDIAKYFSETKTNKNIFKIMMDLNNLETNLEKIKIKNMIMASALIERYKDFIIAKINRIEYIKTMKKIYLLK